MNSKEKRASSRAPVLLRIRLRYPTVEHFVEKFATNISRGGMFISSRSPKPPQTKLRFELRIVDDSPVIKGDGVVRWIREYNPKQPRQPFGMGIEFQKLSKKSQEILEQIIAYRLEQGLPDNETIPLREPPGTSTDAQIPEDPEEDQVTGPIEIEPITPSPQTDLPSPEATTQTPASTRLEELWSDPIPEYQQVLLRARALADSIPVHNTLEDRLNFLLHSQAPTRTVSSVGDVLRQSVSSHPVPSQNAAPENEDNTELSRDLDAVALDAEGLMASDLERLGTSPSESLALSEEVSSDLASFADPPDSEVLEIPQRAPSPNPPAAENNMPSDLEDGLELENDIDIQQVVMDRLHLNNSLEDVEEVAPSQSATESRQDDTDKSTTLAAEQQAQHNDSEESAEEEKSEKKRGFFKRIFRNKQ